MNGYGQAAPASGRVLVWQVTADRECYACTKCSWTYPNPNKLTEKEHDTGQVQRRFAEHFCNRELPPKKFTWE